MQRIGWTDGDKMIGRLELLTWNWSPSLRTLTEKRAPGLYAVKVSGRLMEEDRERLGIRTAEA